MAVRFLLGPAGSGKTYTCLAEIRSALAESPTGKPLILLAPKQATFQLERQLLTDGGVSGYTRLQILSFERLAQFVLEHLGQAAPNLLDEQGRVMVIRSLLTKLAPELNIFRSISKRAGFAQSLSLFMREAQRAKIHPEELRAAAGRDGLPEQTAAKLRDVAVILEAYLAWLRDRELHDAYCLLDLAADAVKQAQDDSEPWLSGLWMDGFAEMTPQELDLAAVVAQVSERSTLAFCLDQAPREEPHWVSTWSIIAHTYRKCAHALTSAGLSASVEVLNRSPESSRFSGRPALAALERNWAGGTVADPGIHSCAEEEIVLRRCLNPEEEAVMAAREIWRLVRDEGARFNEIAVLTRSLDGYDEALRRVFNRYEIPFFLDQRRPANHHPLAELTRMALRTGIGDWPLDEWMQALKTGLTPIDESLVDEIENEALERGWAGRAVWDNPIAFRGPDWRVEKLEQARQRVMRIFGEFADRLRDGEKAAEPDGGAHGERVCRASTVSDALRDLWQALGVADRLAEWSGLPNASGSEFPSTAHGSLWKQMQAFLASFDRAFDDAEAPLREWLGVIEAGLSSLTVGVIPPAIDQVLIGAIDRSRNPDLQVVFILGANEGVFPMPPPAPILLSDQERSLIEGRHIHLGVDARRRLGHERFFGYVALTRARKRVVVSCSRVDMGEGVLNPSPFIGRVQRIFPELQMEEVQGRVDWVEAVRAVEALPAFLDPSEPIGSIDGFAPDWRTRVERLREFAPDESLSVEMARELYGPVLRISATELERYAACPFQFFARSGLRVQERKKFEADRRSLGEFEHLVLRRFHEAVTGAGRRWRDLDAAEARELIGKIGKAELEHFNAGLLVANPADRSEAERRIAGLEDFIEVIINWMEQYQFDPAAVELQFGMEGGASAWELELDNGLKLAFVGSVDRVDIFTDESGAARAVVIDYKSKGKKLDNVFLRHGIQLQLPAYLAAIGRLNERAAILGSDKIIPAGMFYVTLRGHFPGAKSRAEVMTRLDDERRIAYRHIGRFDRQFLGAFDHRSVTGKYPDDQPAGDQFNYQLTRSGAIHGRCAEPLEPDEFAALIDETEALIKRMGREIFSGAAAIAPYRKSGAIPCQYCDFKSVCRSDSWTQEYRSLS